MTAILRRLCVLFESSHYAKDPLRLPTSAVPVMANRRSAKPYLYIALEANVLNCRIVVGLRPGAGLMALRGTAMLAAVVRAADLGRATAAWDWLAARYAGGWRGRPVAGPDRGHTDEYRA